MKLNLSALDGIRGIAVVAVFFFHFSASGAFQTVPIVRTTAMTGWLGVDLFFALSGYLITRSAFSKKQRDDFLRTFYLSRIRRILPAYSVALTILLPAIFMLFKGMPELQSLKTGIVCLALFCSNMQTALLSTALPFGLNHFWSLAVEVQLYVAWPVLVLFLDKRRMLLLALILAVMSFFWRLYVAGSSGNWIWTYFSTPTRLDSFALGACVYLMPMGGFRRPSAWFCLSLGLIVGAVVAWQNSGIAFSQPWSNSLGIAAAALFASGLILLVVDGSVHPLTKALSSRLPVALGSVSYSFYIFHFPIIGMRWFLTPTAIYSDLGTSLRGDLMMAIYVFALSLLAAIVSYFVVERPFFQSRWRRLRYSGLANERPCQGRL